MTHQNRDLDDEPYAPGVGRMLISLREILRILPRELADALGIPESEVLQAERTEYRGFSVARASGVMGALHALHQGAGHRAEAPGSANLRIAAPA